MMWTFITKDGERKEGKLVHQYPAFEGGMRYIFQTDTGRQYRCIREDTENGFRYVEYVA